MSTWKDRAPCRGISNWHEIFFPLDYNRKDRWDQAKQFCDICPVTEECLWMQLRSCDPMDDRWGMFGGLTPSDRRKYRQNPEVKKELGLPIRVRVKQDDRISSEE
jgi:hypothetical protein